MSWLITPTLTWNETVWNPSMITTALWLDANDSGTVARTGSTVTTWNDKSGNGNNFTIAGNPQYETTGLSTSKPAVAFDGTGDYMTRTLSGLTAFNSFDFYCVFQSTLAAAPNTASASLYTAGDLATASAMSLFSSTGALTDEYITFALGSGARLGVGSSYSRSSNAAQILNSRQSASGYALLADGNQLTLNLSTGMTAGTNTSPAALSLGNDTLYLAANFSPVAASAAIKIAEIIILSSLESTFGRQRIEGYLAHKWGLTANLPSDHPYKTVGPTP